MSWADPMLLTNHQETAAVDKNRSRTYMGFTVLHLLEGRKAASSPDSSNPKSSLEVVQARTQGCRLGGQMQDL